MGEGKIKRCSQTSDWGKKKLKKKATTKKTLSAKSSNSCQRKNPSAKRKREKGQERIQKKGRGLLLRMSKSGKKTRQEWTSAHGPSPNNLGTEYIDDPLKLGEEN